MSRVDEKKVSIAELQISEKHRTITYDTREYPVEVIVAKYLKGLDDDENDFFIPDYQRDLTWPESDQSRFIESVLMGLPIPLLFLADVDREGRAEIIDGSQRVRTLARFLNDELELSGLKNLDAVNGFKYSDLPASRRRRFNRHTIRMIEIVGGIDEEARRDLFDRLNTGGLKINPMERRRGTLDGDFLKFIESCASDPRFAELVPLSEKSKRLKEPEEFVLRFFVYLNSYQNFERSVIEFINEYVSSMEPYTDECRARDERDCNAMLEFSKKYLNTFAKKTGHVRTPRIRFESLSVGIALALREEPGLTVSSMDWIDSDEFKSHTRSDASNSRPKVKARIEYVRDQLLNSRT